MKKVNKETLRMQMLAGIITESQYKNMLNENDIDYNSFFQSFLDNELSNYHSEDTEERDYINSYRNKTVSSLNELAEYIMKIEDEMTEDFGAYHGEFYGELRERLIDLFDEENFSEADELLSILDKNYEGHY